MEQMNMEQGTLNVELGMLFRTGSLLIFRY